MHRHCSLSHKPRNQIEVQRRKHFSEGRLADFLPLFLSGKGCSVMCFFDSPVTASILSPRCVSAVKTRFSCLNSHSDRHPLLAAILSHLARLETSSAWLRFLPPHPSVMSSFSRCSDFGRNQPNRTSTGGRHRRRLVGGGHRGWRPRTGVPV